MLVVYITRRQKSQKSDSKSRVQILKAGLLVFVPPIQCKTVSSFCRFSRLPHWPYNRGIRVFVLQILAPRPTKYNSKYSWNTLYEESTRVWSLTGGQNFSLNKLSRATGKQSSLRKIITNKKRNFETARTLLKRLNISVTEIARILRWNEMELGLANEVPKCRPKWKLEGTCSERSSYELSVRPLVEYCCRRSVDGPFRCLRIEILNLVKNHGFTDSVSNETDRQRTADTNIPRAGE